MRGTAMPSRRFPITGKRNHRSRTEKRQYSFLFASKTPFSSSQDSPASFLCRSKDMSSQRAPPCFASTAGESPPAADSAGLPTALHTCATGKQGRISFSFFICRPRLFGRSADRAFYNTFIISNQEKFGNTAAADSIPPQKKPAAAFIAMAAGWSTDILFKFLFWFF